jgi:hypothetical protein
MNPDVLATLTDAERRFLAMHATYESRRQDDFRYWDSSPQHRVELRQRWQQIADAFHENPWSSAMIVYISIGNSDDKLPQKEWADLIADIDDDVLRAAHVVHGRWFSAPDSAWQNACWCIEFPANVQDGRVASLKSDLTTRARTYGQDSIAWAEVQQTEFLG